MVINEIQESLDIMKTLCEAFEKGKMKCLNNISSFTSESLKGFAYLAKKELESELSKRLNEKISE